MSAPNAAPWSVWQKTKQLLSTIGSWIWLVVSIVVFPIGLSRLFLYYDGKKTPGGKADRFFFRPILFLWVNFLRGIVKFIWFVFCVVTVIPALYYGTKWVVTGSARVFWTDFGSFIGTWSRAKDGTWNWMRFTSFGDMFHFHLLSWPLSSLALIQWYMGVEKQWIGVTFLVLHVLAIRTYFSDLPAQKFFFRFLPLIALLIVADVGVRFGFQNFWPRLEGAEIPLIGGMHIPFTDSIISDLPEDISFGERGFIVPFWNWVNSGELHIATWMLFIYSLVWWYVMFKVVSEGLLNRRTELDSRTIENYRWMEQEETLQVYMRNSKAIFPDVFETVFSLTGDISLDTNKGTRVYRNVFLLPILLAAYNGLRNSKTIRERKDSQREQLGEDAADLVKDPAQELKELGHGESEIDGHSNSVIVQHEDQHETDADDESNEEGFLDVEGERSS